MFSDHQDPHFFGPSTHCADHEPIVMSQSLLSLRLGHSCTLAVAQSMLLRMGRLLNMCSRRPLGLGSTSGPCFGLVFVSVPVYLMV